MGEYTCSSRMWLCVCLVLVSVAGCCADPLHGSVIGRPEDVQEDVATVCEMKGCNCTAAQSDKWIIVNCTFNNRQRIDLRQGLLPQNMMELSVIGGDELHFHAQLFSGMRNLWRIRIDGTRSVVFRSQSLVNINVTNLFAEILQCENLNFEHESFANEGPVVLEVSRCGRVAVHKSAFKFLQSARFQDIPVLDLMEGAFILKHKVNENHGPITTIRFRNVKIPTLHKDSFKSTLAEVSFLDSEISNVMSEAFSGNTITAVTITNSSLQNMYAAAFSGRTLLNSLDITGSRIKVIFSEAVLSATANLTIQHSKIKTIHSGAINSTIARTIFTNNDIGTFHSRGFTIPGWSQIYIENNTFDDVNKKMLDVPYKPSSCQDPCEITFTNNDISNMQPGALDFISIIPTNVKSNFENNNFKHACHCGIDGWLEEILGTKCPNFVKYNYCIVDSLISDCYDIQEGPVIMKNFTDTVCATEKDVLQCKTYSVDANVVNNEFTIEENNSQLIFGVVIGAVLLVAVVGTVLILLIHGGMWLKRKGYCVRFNNFHQYRVEEESTEVEDIMVTTEKTPENHLPEELSQELLQALREKLEDPTTYNEAREMIERLYDHFIIEESYTNNNRQEEETHLYEELGNLSQPNPAQEKPSARPFSFLRLIEERFNLLPPEQPRSVLVGEYSEPTDAEVHLYSELPQNKEGKQNEINEGLTQLGDPGSSTQRSNGSGRMAYRPLPDKPRIGLDPGEGPSTKF